MRESVSFSEVSKPQFVIKRDGKQVPFDAEKIVRAVLNSAMETNEFGEDEARHIAFKVVKILTHKYKNDVPNIEQIQDLIEEAIISENYFKTARAYIVYREKRGELRRDKKNLVDVVVSINEYLDQLDWRVRANANQGYSLGGMILNIAGKMTANYWLNKVYPDYVSESHRNGDFHIHDLDMLSGYCAGWSLRTLLNEGFNGVPGKAEAKPPKHLSSAIGQMVNFLGTLQNEWAGAQAFSSFDTYIAPFLRVDNLSYTEVKQCIQEFIYNLNVPSRWGTQTPFTNLTFDWVCPDDLKNTVPLIGGVEANFTYGELQKEMDIVNRAYIEVMTEGDSKGRVFTFPIPTYNITKDFPWESENAMRMFEMTAKYGLPYFQNFVNSDLTPGMVRSMCCRLQLDLRELLKRGNSLFGSAEQTGSIGVVTLNCARLGYVHKGDWDALIKRTEELMNFAKISLEIKRKVVTKYMDEGLFPYTKRYLGTLRNHFSTIGVNGINEMIRNFTHDKYDIVSKEGHNMAIAYLDKIREKLVEFQQETGHMYNLEATPAEGTTYRFAKEDKKRFSDILQAGTPENPYYTNSSQLPVNFTEDAFEALRMQDDLQKKYTGGTVLHLYMRERITNAKTCARLVKKVVENFRLPYFTITPTFSICPKHQYIAGEHKFCPICDAELRAKKKAELEKQKRKQEEENSGDTEQKMREEASWHKENALDDVVGVA